MDNYLLFTVKQLRTILTKYKVPGRSKLTTKKEICQKLIQLGYFKENHLTNQPNEIIYHIILKLPIEDIISLSQTNIKLYKLGLDDFIWKSIFKREFPNWIYTKPPNKTWRNMITNYVEMNFIKDEYYYPLSEPGWYVGSDIKSTRYQYNYQFKDPIIIMVPATRYATILDKITLNYCPIEQTDILKEVLKYYNNPLTMDDLTNYLIQDKSSDITQAIDKIKNNGQVLHKDIITQKGIIFEGLKYINDNVYEMQYWFE